MRGRPQPACVWYEVTLLAGGGCLPPGEGHADDVGMQPGGNLRHRALLASLVTRPLTRPTASPTAGVADAVGWATRTSEAARAQRASG